MMANSFWSIFKKHLVIIVFGVFFSYFLFLDDRKSDLKVYGTTDDFMYLVLKELGLTLPTKTPAGVELPPFAEPNIKETYEEKRKQTQKEKEKKDKETGKQLGLFGNDVNSTTLKPRGNFVQDLKNTDKDITQASSTQVLFLRNNTSCKFHIKSNCVKLIIENCKDCEITITGNKKQISYFFLSRISKVVY